MRKIMERCMAALLAAALVCSLGFSVLAEGGSIQPTSTAVPVGSSDAADVSSSVPPTEPESTPLPESTPASSAAPSETPLPSETPGTGETPAPTETPQATATPMPTPTPAETPSPSAMPEPSGTPAPTATPAPAFEKLEVTDTTGAVQAEVGDEVEFSVELNRDDVEVAYQWQVLDTAPGQEEQPEAIYDYGEGESTDYFFPLEDMTEEELLAQNPGATWPGIEMYYALRDSQVSTFSTRSASAEPPRIENGTPNFVLNPEETDVEAGEIAWRDIDGETKASYVHTVTENEEHLSYRCIVTVTDEEYLAEAQQAAQSAAEGAEPQESEAGEEVPTEAESAENGPSSVPESAPESTVPEKEETSAPDESEQPVSESTAEGLAEESIITETMHIEVPAQPEEDQPEEETQGLMAGLFSLFRANGTAPDVKLSEDNQWLVGMDTTMEYITANTYEEQDASAANNPYWTKIAGGTRPDGTQYKDTFLTDGNKMEVLSAWYGKTVYVRIAGNSGKGTAIEIPAYTGIDYQTGERVLYKKSVKVFNAWVPNTGRSFYQAFLRTALNDGWAADNCHLTIDSAPADDFNKYPTWYLTNAEGDYVYDLVIWGSATMEIPDLSGAAAWALQDYLAKGYGFMIGHDMMYHYGGVAGEGYVPDPNDTTTPYYQLNTDMAGSWNMNWLMGQNEMYDVANPYDAASMILCCGNWHDKTPLYGDDSGSSTLRVVTRTEGDPFTSVAARCPTNYPYNASFQGPEFTVGLTIDASATHTNMQMAFGTIWVDYASNSIEQKGFGRLMTATRAGLQGTNNFYLTTNGSFGMNQIGHKTANFNVAKIDECRILANTVMYLSQRQQCQVCQSQQNGNQEVHFVHRISSAEELAKLNDQDKYWFTHPIGDCYILANDIVLPDDWTPIQGFTGHFDADSHTITLGANGAPVFDTGTKGWNLGSEKEKGTPAIVDAGGGRTTGVARVVGYLSGLGLEDAGGTQGYTVTVFGTDGNEYSCVANRDGKYVLSNLPCTGVMQAEVKDRSGNVVISREIGRVCVPGTLDDYAIPVRNGEEHAQTAEGFWASAETTQLYVLGLEALPVLNTTIYEEQDAIMLEGGARYHQLVTDIKWEYRTKGSRVWLPIEDSGLAYEVSEPVFHEAGEESWTETTLTLRNVPISWDGTNFRAVVSSNGTTKNTYDVATKAKSGLLTVLPRPIYLQQAKNTTVYVDQAATFVAEADFFKTLEQGLQVRWQYRVKGFDWLELGDFSSFEFETAATSQANAGTANPELAPHHITATLTLPGCELDLDDYEFQAVFSYPSGLLWGADETVRAGELGTSLANNVAEEREGRLNVLPGVIEATKPEDVTVQLTHPATVYEDEVMFESTVTYRPDDVGNAEPPAIGWRYKNGLAGQYAEWTQEAAAAIWPDMETRVVYLDASGAEVDAPVALETGNPDEKKVTTRLYLKNVPLEMDEGENHYFFAVQAATQHLRENIRASSAPGGLSIDYSIHIKHRDAEVADGTSGSKLYTYPQLEIVAPNGLRTVTVQFAGEHDKRDAIQYGTLPGGITASKASGADAITFSSKDLIPAADWQAFIRTLEYTVYDDEATLYWYIDENESNLQYDSSTGHFYEFVPAEGIQWTAAYQAAGGYFNDELNATGYLMQIDSEAEQQTAERLADGKKVWVGGTKNTSFSGTTDWSWMTASGAHKLEGYTNWASGQPGTASDRMYMSLNTNGQWLAERNDGTQSYTVVDMAQHWGNVNLYLNSPSRGYDINLTNGHKYYVHAAGAGVGDSNASLRFDFPALGISFTTNSYKDYLNKSTIVTYTGATGKQTGTFAIQHTGPDVSGIYTQIQQFDVIDLTAVFGAGNEPSAAYCAQFNGMTGSKTVTYNSETTDKAGYLIEYGEADVNFSRNTRSAYDIDVVPDGLDGRRTVKVAISAEDRVYDGTETNAQVSFRLDGGGTLPEADAEELLAALQVTYTETGKTTDANGTGSEAIHSNNLELYHATVAPKDAASPILAKYLLEFENDGKCTFRILPRPLHVYSTDNDREYDGTTNATVTNLKFRAADDESGVVAGDKVAVTPDSFAGVHSVIDQTDGKQVEITRRVDVRLSLSNNELGDYYIASEEYTGAVLPRSLHVHSLYLDDGDDANNPRNIKQYDGTDAAVISDILIDGIIDGDEVWVDKDSYAGTYAQSDAGEDLTADGTAKPNRYRNLKEVDITRTEAIALVHNEKGNYRIASEDYSGAIYRRALSIMVGHMVTTYGDGLDETPTTAGTYSATEGGSGTHLTISALVANDVLKLDDSKGGFVYDAITEKTPAGTYPLDYEGINETNYPVLSNYIIWQEPGDITVLPRKITITVNPSEKVYGDANPAFSVSYEGFINDDTPEDMLEGELEYKTDCDERSPVRYYDDGSYAPYEVSASGLTCKENENYEYNYEIEWVPGPLVVKRRPVVITGPTIEINEGEPVPPFHYTPENPLVNGDEFVSGGLFTDPENPTAPGEYPILSDLDAGPNYDLTYIPGKLIINQHLGVIKMYLPQEEATVHTPDGMTYTVSGNPGKPFPKTDVNITEVENATENEDGSITVPFGFTSAEGEEPGYTPPEMVEYQGKTYVLAEKDVQINASEAPAGKEETVHYDGLTEKTVPDTYHIENGAQSYDLVLKDVSYAEAEPSTLTIDYVSSAEPAAPQTYTANVDGKPVTFILSGIEQTSDYAWRPLDMPVEYWGHPLAKYYLGEISKGRAMPYNKARPYYDGYEADILDYLGVSDKEYRIAASKWTDDGFQAIEHQLRRRGTITLEHYTATWTATYVSASLGYTAEAVYTDDINGTVSYTALATYKPAGGFPVLRAVVIASAGIALLILAIILILLALKKKREQEGLNKSDSKGEIPQNPFYK